MPPPTDRCVGGIMFLGCLSECVLPCMRPCMRASVEACFVLTRCLTSKDIELHQTSGDCAVEVTDELIRF